MSPLLFQIPLSLSEIYLLEFNLMFPTLESFTKVKDILAICLATLKPLTLEQIFMCVKSLKESNADDLIKLDTNPDYVSAVTKVSMKTSHQFISWDEFLNNFDMISSWLLPERADKTIMFFHSTVRDW